MESVFQSSAPSRRICEQARLSRDPRFDGLFFIAVRTTGIYCRTVCPAPTAKSRNVDYFPNAAAASAAGYRPCLRCRPEAAPGTPLRPRSGLVGAALRLIERGALDDASVATLATRIGVGERHLRRLFVEELGAGPLDIAATRRLLFAKQLLNETALPVTQIALASGYRSVRRFNAAFLASYRQPPRALRRAAIAQATPQAAVTLRLPYRKPYDFDALLAFFARRAIPGVEQIDAESYTRNFAFDGNAGSFAVRKLPGDDALALSVSFAHAAHLQEISSRVRRMFDVDADIAAINRDLRRDPLLRPLVRRHPGQRLPGGWDGFEIAIRAVLGQQVSVAAARTLTQRLVERYGTRVTANGAPLCLFPLPEVIADAELGALGITGARIRSLQAIARAVCDGHVSFRPEQTLDEFVASWTQLPGIGPWTAHYIAMRALSHPDAFPAADLVLRKAVGGNGALAPVARVEQIAEAWRPWRAYTVFHLWRSV
jgi:AraC family transcriptional regulator of adaptative response / DNA-3-methyladenine glycosylase II